MRKYYKASLPEKSSFDKPAGRYFLMCYGKKSSFTIREYRVRIEHSLTTTFILGL